MDNVDHDKTFSTSGIASGWRTAGLAWLIAVLVILVLFRETLLSMVAIWARSDTFAHGFLVLPISLWLVWRLRGSLAELTPRPDLRVLPLFLLAGFAWLLGEVASVAPLSQFSLVMVLILSVPAVFGGAVTKRLLFPLGFLLFAVPFGEFALPVLMNWTASATVWGLRLSGVPVYREGLSFVIPSGHWSVVEACSGVRYLIASLMIGTLFAYLNYRSLKRRWLFVGVAIIVPVFANWLRAYMIVMLGHLSGNTLAVGVDHLIYGWLFFGVVIMLMFWVGSRWREDVDSVDDQTKASASVAVHRSAKARGSVALAASLVVLSVAIWPFAEWRIGENIKPDSVRITPITPASGWSVAAPLADWSPRYLNPSQTSATTHGKGDDKVGLYLAYYRNQGDERKLVSSSNVLVHSSDRRWFHVADGRRQITMGDETLDARTAELRSADGMRLIVWQWYWINGRLIASDYLAKAYTALYRLLGQGDDSALIVVYTEKTDTAEELLRDFVATHLPSIRSALSTARDGHD